MRLMRNERGDSIIEVLITIAIISLVLIGAFAATRRNTLTSQDTQEHSQALKLVETQLEFLHNNNGLTGGTCYTSTGAVASGGSCDFGTTPTYTLNVTQPGGAGNPYMVRATWPSLKGGTARVTMYYRPFQG